jgi:SAM-dependent methyltransferase
MTPQIDDHGAALAELFDLDYGDFDDDLPFYEALAREAGGPVLELGVGTGRVARRLAGLGHDVCGIDNSATMLNRARCHAGDLPNLQVVHADMRDFALGKSFAFIYAGYGAFHHLLTSKDQVACLRSMERHLVSGGVVAFDLRAHWATDWDADPDETICDWTRAASNGDLVTKLRSVRVDRAAQVQHETYHFDRKAPNGTVHRVTAQVELRFSTRYEVEFLLQEAGLELESFYGDYDLRPYETDSDLMITVARKPVAS